MHNLLFVQTTYRAGRQKRLTDPEHNTHQNPNAHRNTQEEIGQTGSACTCSYTCITTVQPLCTYSCVDMYPGLQGIFCNMFTQSRKGIQWPANAIINILFQVLIIFLNSLKQKFNFEYLHPCLTSLVLHGYSVCTC